MTSRSPTMVGRDVELALLAEALDHARAGRARVALVSGEAGLGKTRLVRALVEGVAGEEAVVAFGHAVPLAGGALPYGVTGDLLRSLAREVHAKAVREALGDRAELLAPLVPRLGVGHYTAALDRPALYAATQDLLADFAADRLLLLVVEDLHWADEESLDLIEFWARTLIRGRLLLLATTRDRGAPDDILARLGELRRLPNASMIDLTPLSSKDVESQLQALGVCADETLRAEIQRLSDGNPLFVEELVANGAGEPSPHLILDLAGRLKDLDPATADAMRLAALEPRPFTADAIAEVVGGPVNGIRSALDDGRAHGIVERGPDGQWSFHHELIRLAMSTSGPTAARDQGHRAWGKALAGPSAGADGLVCAADHFQAAGALRESAAARSRGARAAQLGLGLRAAAWQWRRVLEVLRTDSQAVDEEVHEEAFLGAFGDQLDMADRVRLVLLEESIPGPKGIVRHACVLLERFYLSRVMEGVFCPELSVADVMDLSRRLLAEGERRTALRALCFAVTALDLLGAKDERAELIDRLDAMSTASAQAELAVYVMEWRLTDAAASGARADSQEAIIAQVLSRIDGLGTEARARVRLRRAELLQRQGELVAALAETEIISRSLHGPQVGGYVWTTVESLALELLWLLGRWDDVVKRAETLLADLGQIESHNSAGATVALVHLARGGDEEARHAASRLLPVETTGDGAVLDGATGHSTRHFPAVIKAAAAVVTDPRSARRLLAPVLADEDLKQHLMVGELVLLGASLTTATDDSEPGYATSARAAVSLLKDEVGQGATYRQHAECYLAQSEGLDTVAAWAVVAESWDAMRATLHASQARVAMARCLMRVGDREQAAQALAFALSAAEALGTRPLGDEIRTFAARARLRLPGDESPGHVPSGGLTVRELEVLQLLAQGMTNDQIGTSLFMSPRTASVHVSRILAKLGAANRTEVAAIAHRRGLLD